MTPRPSARSVGEGSLEAVAMLLAGAAGVAAWTGGWRADLFGMTISARGAPRLVLLALAALAVRAALTRDRLAPTRELADIVSRVVSGALLIAGILGWVTHVSPYLGGADSYGYVSAAERIRDGELIRPEPLAELLPYADGIVAATPLGYVPTARAANASVPAYPLGLPAIMAIASVIAGPRAPFFVAPLFGLLLVAVCCALVYRWARDATLALAAGAAVAFHPLVFTYAIQPMSDVPAAACFAAAMALLLVGDGGILAGIAASAAFLIRPALLPGAAALCVIPLAARRLTPAVTFGAMIAVGVVAQAWSQWYLYGHPLANGYGPASELFSLRFFASNVRSYTHWAFVLHGVFWFACVAVAMARIGTLRARADLAMPLLLSAAPYAVYRTYDHWETLRFVLPLLVAATLAAVAGAFVMFRTILPRAGTWLALAIVVFWIGNWIRWLDREQVFERARAEERFARAGELASRATPANAVVIASLHSGSVRYYARRDTLNWGRIPPGRFDATVAALRQAGRDVFVLLDGREEQAEFEARHGDVLDRQQWLPGGQVRDVRVFQAPR